jgi:ubiquinone/menaquinone biosynthesis C-methylase UbiE
MPSIARYDPVADFYVAEIGDVLDDPATAALLGLIGQATGSRLLDLACGQGRVTRELARRGAVVTGADLSAALITQAKAAEETDRLGIEYMIADAGDESAFPAASFDGVVCNFGMSDIDDLDAALATVHWVLKPGGFFVVSLLHPCFPGWTEKVSASWPPGGGYFSEGWWRAEALSSKLRQQVGANHRMISTYLNALTGHGLAIDAVVEPMTPENWLTANPEMDPVPVFLALRCVKR